MSNAFLKLVLFALASASTVLAQQAREAEHYRLDYFRTPEGARVEVGGLDFLPDGRLVVSTRRGQVWIIENALSDDPLEARWKLFAEGLQEGLGLAVVDGVIHVAQRGELSRLFDTDGDGLCDRIECVTNAWGLSDNYHEFGYGLPRDAAGNFYVSLNVGFPNPKWWHGRSMAPWRGWVVRVTPEGEIAGYASGFRSPNGMGARPDGEIFVTDNQGDWMPVCPIVHVREGEFYGHPGSQRWTAAYGNGERSPSDTEPTKAARAPAAIWIPYEWSRSTGSLCWDTTGGKFGPFENQAIVAELTNGMVLRAHMEEVRGITQGAIWPLRQQVGSANRVCFAPDGTLILGLTNRGWGGEPPADGVARLRYTGKLPFEVATVSLRDDGFVLRFTEALAADCEFAAEQVEVIQYDYDWWWEYGSPERHHTQRVVTAIELDAARREAYVKVSGLEAGMMARVTTRGLRGVSGGELLHECFAYTINRLPNGSDNPPPIAKLVPPPPSFESQQEGWLSLSYADTNEDWQNAGWVRKNAELNAEHPQAFALSDGAGAYVPAADAERARLQSRWNFGDVEATFEFSLASEARGVLWLLGRYGLELSDDHALAEGEAPSCARILPGSGGSFAGRAPDRSAVRRPGEWNDLYLRWQAPRFDEQGQKISPARLVRVRMNDRILHESVEIDGPSDGAPLEGEAAEGPLVFDGSKAGLAIRGLRVRRIVDQEPPVDTGWVRIFNGEDLDGWRISDGGQWTVEEGAIVGRGPTSHLFSPRGDYRNFEFRARVKINDNGNSGMYFRVAYGPGWPSGYEAQVNSTFQDPQKSGSLYGLQSIFTRLIPPNVWFDQHIIVRDTEEGTRIRILLNDIEVVDYLDRERKFATGHVALQQHHEGSEVQFRDLEVRELAPSGEELLKRYATFRLTTPLENLAADERAMLPLLIDAAREMDAVFWEMAYGSRTELLARIEDPELRRLAEINYGPWDRLDGDRAFVPGFDRKPKGARFYPADTTKEEIEAASSVDGGDALLSLTTVVERDASGKLIAIPYHTRFAAEFEAAASKLEQAAALAKDEGLKRYLEMRAQALRSDDYRASDLAWMEMKSNGIDIVIGPIETYEDQLFGAKAACEAYVLVKDRAWSERLQRIASLLPEMQRGLPVDAAYKAESPGADSDLGAYDVVYYAGDCNAGSKTIAINLPNDEYVQLQKGTRRLQLKNAMRAKFDAILLPIVDVLIDPEQRALVNFESFFGNTMFHEVAHGLGIKSTLNGKGSVREALRETSGALEECKADVLGLYLVTELLRRGAYEGTTVESHYTTFLAGIFRSVRFGASSAHGQANMLAFHVFQDLGAFTRDEASGMYRVNFDRMREAVAELARRILVLQGDGDLEGVRALLAAEAVIDAGLASDLARVSAAGIPVDVVFEQGAEVLGLK